MTDNRSGVARVLDFIAGHPTVDLGLTVLVATGCWLLDRFGVINLSIAAVPPGQRSLVYGALATVAALAAGSNNTAVGSYVGSGGAAMDSLRRDYGHEMRKALRSVGAWMWAVAAAALACFLIDPADKTDPTHTRGTVVIFALALIVLILKFARLTLIQDIILKANDLSAQRPKSTRSVRRKSRVASGTAEPLER